MAEKENDTENPQFENLRTGMIKHLEKPLSKGDSWFLVDNHWFKQLKKYLEMEGIECNSGRKKSANPGPIDNKPLFKSDSSDIRDHMIDELDFVLVPEEAWDLLVYEFGIREAQEPVKRKVVEHGMFVKHCKVEVYLLELQLAENSNLKEIIKKKFSKADTIEHIQNVTREVFSIEKETGTKLWNKYASNIYEELTRLDNTVQDTGLFSGSLIIIEIIKENVTSPRQARRFVDMESDMENEAEIASLRKVIKDQQEVNRNLKIEKEEEQRKYKELLQKYKFLANKLKDKIECPVCLDIPRSGPVPVCINGHVVCKNCKTESCPTCRVDMGNGNSLIAVTILENVEHECKFDECNKSFALDKLDDHLKVCGYRTVACPQKLCMERVALPKLLDHLCKATCCYDSEPRLLEQSLAVGQLNFGLNLDERSDHNLYWNLHICSSHGASFAIYSEKHEEVYYFTAVMFDSEEECSKYKVEITVHQYSKTVKDCDASFKFSGKPCSIDKDKNRLKFFGLSVISEGMEQILNDNRGFSITFSVSRK